MTIPDAGIRQDEQNPAVVYLSGLRTEAGRRVMHHALTTIADMLSGGTATIHTPPWHTLRSHHVQELRSALLEHYASATVNRMLYALRGTLRVAWKLGQLSAEDYRQVRDVPGVRSDTRPTERFITKHELAALMQACTDNTPTGVRDAAIIALLAAAGLRRSELVGLMLEDYDPQAGTLRVRGKDGRDRLILVAAGAAEALAAWPAVRGRSPGPIFWATHKGGRMRPQGMTTQAVYAILHQRAAQAGIQVLNPNDLRRTFIADLLESGTNLIVVRRLVGHAHVATTVKYYRR